MAGDTGDRAGVRAEGSLHSPDGHNSPSPRRRRPVLAVLAVLVAVVVVLILIIAFRQDMASASAQRRDTPVALAAVRDNASLKVEVIAGGTAPFSGTVALEDSSSRLATWTLRALRPGESWATVVPLAPAGPLKDVHVTDRSGLRSLTIAPLASHGGNTQ